MLDEFNAMYPSEKGYDFFIFNTDHNVGLTVTFNDKCVLEYRMTFMAYIRSSHIQEKKNAGKNYTWIAC